VATLLPQRTRIYQNYSHDSARWDRFVPRDDDIIIATPPRTGTTWTQEIVLHLVFLGREVPYREEVSPWLDHRVRPLDEVLSMLENQRHRRFIKTHLALDGLPFFPQVKYIVVGRDPRDIFMSQWSFFRSFTPDYSQAVNSLPDRVGPSRPPCPDDIHEFWRSWISRGWYAWQQEGYPFPGAMYHLQSWWNFRLLSNILLVHFADLLANAPQQVRRIADFLDIVASDEQLVQIAQQTSLTAMRTRAEEKDARMAKTWVDGARSFFYKGTNGRWRDVLTDEELAQYEEKASKVLTLDCRAWLEQGQAALA
jgi:aryl sulfotransferase